jgi:hypothetical protein
MAAVRTSTSSHALRMSDILKPQKITLAIFGILFAFAQFGWWFGGALITWPIYPIVSDIQVRVGADTSDIAIHNQFQYGIALPIHAVFVYLISCWAVFILKNIGGLHNGLAISTAVCLFLLYLLPSVYYFVQAGL